MKPGVGYMYLTATLPDNKVPKGYHEHRVGVVAFRYNPERPEQIVVAASMTSQDDQFVPKLGVSKAVHRLLKTKRKHLVLESAKLAQKPMVQNIVEELKLSSPNNHFEQINWKKTNTKFKKTIKCLLNPKH